MASNSREWVYYDCVLNMQEIRVRFELPGFIEAHINDDFKSGPERGFVCTRCQDAVISIYPNTKKCPLIFR